MPHILYAPPTGLGSGDPNVSLEGTGVSIPRGIEAVYEYDNFIFNDLSVIDKYRVTGIDGFDDADVRDSREENPGEDFETAYDSFYGGRTIVFTGKIEAFRLHKLRDMQTALKNAFADLTEKPLWGLTGSQDSDFYINCKKLSKIQIDEKQPDYRFFRDFQVTLRASDPRFYRKRKKKYILDETTTAINVVNAGNMYTESTITVYGTVSNFELTEGLNNQVIGFEPSLVLEDDEFVRLTSTNDRAIDNFGDSRINDLTEESNFIKIPRNLSTLSLGETTSFDSANARIEIEFQDAYL
jgi:hypothetical protein